MLWNDDDDEFLKGNYFQEFSDFDDFLVKKAKSRLVKTVKSSINRVYILHKLRRNKNQTKHSLYGKDHATRSEQWRVLFGTF